MRKTLRVVAGAAAVAALLLAAVAVLVAEPWLWAVVAVCVLGSLGAAVASRRATGPRPDLGADRPAPDEPAATAAAPARQVDDLPTFFASPPGSPTALPAGGPAPVVPDAPDASAPAAGLRPGSTRDGVGRPRRRGGVLAAVVALVVVGGGWAVAVSTSTSPSARTAADGASAGRTSAAGPTAATSPAAPVTAAAAGDLAGLDLPAGDGGFTASTSSPGVVLQRRAVGVTVAYPVLVVDSDGTRAVAHLDLPLWNCLADAAPADPVAAQCSRAVDEHADLGSPDLQTERSVDGADLSGSFATYTRPAGSTPVYTGRSYTLTATIAELPGPGDTVTGWLTLDDTRVQARGEGSFSG